MINKKYKELIYKGSTIKEKYLIEEILIKENMGWFVDAEVENVRLEIQKNTLIFNGGTWYNGVWKYGAWRSGEWKYGKWVDGVWFDGVWFDGVFENGIIFNGTFLKGNFMSGKIRSKNQNGTETNAEFIDCEVSESIKKI